MASSMRQRRGSTSIGRRLLAAPWLVALLAILVLVALPASPVAAHAFLKESDPAANAILPAAPPQVTLRFTERLERSYSRAELYDQTGAAVSGTVSREGDDAYAMVLDLPSTLPNGT